MGQYLLDQELLVDVDEEAEPPFVFRLPDVYRLNLPLINTIVSQKPVEQQHYITEGTLSLTQATPHFTPSPHQTRKNSMSLATYAPLPFLSFP